MTGTKSTLKVVFLCTHNSARSQMAEALLRHDAPSLNAAVESYSAGVEARGIHPLAARALSEIGVSAEGQSSKTVTELVAGLGVPTGSPSRVLFDIVVTVCNNAREACPYLPARVLNLHHQFSDPSALDGDEAMRLAAFGAVRDEIRAWLREAVPDWQERARRVQ